MERFPYECKRFEDIDELLSEYDYDFKDWTFNNLIRFYTYVAMLQILQANPYVRPISVYVALLENGYKDRGESRLAREACIVTIAKLQLEGLLMCASDDNGVVTDYTIFEPVQGDRFKYFEARVLRMSINRMIFNHSDVRFPIDDLDIYYSR